LPRDPRNPGGCIPGTQSHFDGAESHSEVGPLIIGGEPIYRFGQFSPDGLGSGFLRISHMGSAGSSFFSGTRKWVHFSRKTCWKIDFSPPAPFLIDIRANFCQLPRHDSSKARRFRQDFGPPETPSTQIFSGSGIWLRRRRALFSGPLNMGCRPVEGGFSPASIWVPHLLSGVLFRPRHVYAISVTPVPNRLNPVRDGRMSRFGSP
jgi:hypothetical protein